MVILVFCFYFPHYLVFRVPFDCPLTYAVCFPSHSFETIPWYSFLSYFMILFFHKNLVFAWYFYLLFSPILFFIFCFFIYPPICRWCLDSDHINKFSLISIIILQSTNLPVSASRFLTQSFYKYYSQHASRKCNDTNVLTNWLLFFLILL